MGSWKKLKEKALKEDGAFLTYSGDDPNVVLESMFENLMKYNKLCDVEDVHAVRVDIRALRALLAFCNVQNPFDEALKALFKTLDETRKLDVFSKMLSENRVVNRKLEKKRSKQYEMLTQSVLTHIDQIRSAYVPSKLEFTLSEILSDYTKQISRLEVGSSEIRDVKKLHRLRISGKKLKYMIEAGMISCTPEEARSINKLHSAIGNYHDIYEARKLIKRFNIKKTVRLKKYLKKLKQKSLKTIEKEIYYLQQRIVYTSRDLKRNERAE